MHSKVAAVGVALLVALVAGSQEVDAAPAMDQESVVMAVRGEIYNLDPLVTATGDSQRWGLKMCDSPYKVDGQRKMEPLLAMAVKVSDDGLAYVDTLRDGVDVAGRDRGFGHLGEVLHDDGHSILVPELFYLGGKKRDLEWQPQVGIALLNLRDLRGN